MPRARHGHHQGTPRQLSEHVCGPVVTRCGHVVAAGDANCCAGADADGHVARRGALSGAVGFTGSGFTTSESESVINHPVRRQIIMLLMLLGNVGIATVVATVMLSMLQTVTAEQWWWHVSLFLGGLVALLLVAKSRRVEHHMNKVIAVALRRWTRLDVTDYVSLLQLQNGYAVTEMQIEPEDWLAGMTLADASLSKEGVLVLGIQRPNGSYVGAPHADDEIRAGDILILYAPTKRLAELDQRTKGYRGELAHSEAVTEYEKSRLEEHDAREEGSV